MHDQKRATCRAGIFQVLGIDESGDADLLDGKQVGDRAGSIFGPITDIQAGEGGAGEFVAIRATPGERDALFAGLDLAAGAGGRLGSRVSAAAGTWILLPVEGATEAAIDPARGDEIRGG